MKRTIFAMLFFSVVGAQGQNVIVPAPFPIPEPPQLVISSGASEPMQLREMEVKASVRGLYATVETLLVFFNPNKGSQLEGELRFPLPDRASVCGYALDINGVLVDGVVVPKEKARVAFETETRRRIDPGLVEHVKGNLYRTRIYPLPACGERKIRLTYVTPLVVSSAGDAGLALPMPRQKIAKRSITIEVADLGATPLLGGLGDARFSKAERFWRVSAVENDLTPGADVFVALPKLPESFSVVERDDDGKVWFTASMRVPLFKRAPLPLPKEIEILWDASGSRADASATAPDLAWIQALPAEIERFHLRVFRNTVEPSRTFTKKETLMAALKEIRYDGGTDFQALSKTIGKGTCPRLLFTDGLDTISSRPYQFEGTPPIALVSAVIADRETLRHACAGAVVELQETPVATGVRNLFAYPPLRLSAVEGTGVSLVQGIGSEASGFATVLGRLDCAQTEVSLKLGTVNFSRAIKLNAAEARKGTLLATAWASSRITSLAPYAESFEEELLTLGKKYGLVSPVTSLLVLETLDQWVRHQIEPPVTLPQLRERWNAAMKSKRDRTERSEASHLERLVKLWNARVEWWERDYEKDPYQRPPAQVAERPQPRGVIARLFSRNRQTSASMVLEDSSAMVVSEPADSAMMEAPSAPAKAKQGANSASSVTVRIQPWVPKTPYLEALGKVDAERESAYAAQRKEYAQSPAFYLDCAEHFFQKGDRAAGLRILSNLAELRLEDSALLRVYAWRLRQAEAYDEAILLLRRIVRLRGEEPQSYRDLAVTLIERGKARRNAKDLEEAAALLVRVALTPWARHADSIPLFAVEEYNALIAWSHAQTWKVKPVFQPLDKRLCKLLDTDVRIVLTWDADATDIDLHVLEPTGEEAYYGRNRTAKGGLVSRDITDGYGPEEYMIRRAPAGQYQIRAKYYGSRQQTVFGPATVSATVFTNWGRKDETRQMLTLRLEKVKEMVDVGTILFGSAPGTLTAGGVTQLKLGMKPEEVEKCIGAPNGKNGTEWVYLQGKKTLRILFSDAGTLLRAEEILPGGVKTVLVQ